MGTEALSDAAATGLIFAAGAGGSLVLILTLTVLAIRRAEHQPYRRHRERVTVGGGGTSESGGDGYPPQPYSDGEPRSHQPYSRPYRVPRQDPAHNSRNGQHPSGSTGLPTAPWPPGED